MPSNLSYLDQVTVNINYEADSDLLATLPQPIRDWLNYDASFRYASAQTVKLFKDKGCSVSRTLEELRRIDRAMLRINAVEYSEMNAELRQVRDQRNRSQR